MDGEIETQTELFAAAFFLTPDERKQGQKFARVVSRKKRTRQIAINLLAGLAPSSGDSKFLIELLQKPSGFRWREARLAAWLLGFVPEGDAQRTAVVKTLADDLKKLHWSNLIKMFLIRQALFVTPLTLWFAWLFHNDSVLPMSPMLLLAFLLANLCVVLPNYLLIRGPDDWTYSLLRRVAAQSLGRLEMPEAAAALAAATNDYPMMDSSVGWRKVRRIARENLPRVLATLRPEHYLQLDPAIVPNLTLLTNDRDENLALLALDALGKVGDGRAVLPVQRIAEKHSSPRRREIAHAILPLLYYRQQQENSYTHLLRASDAPVGPDTLLRAASGPSDAAPETLLRPSSFDLDLPESESPETETGS